MGCLWTWSCCQNKHVKQTPLLPGPPDNWRPGWSSDYTGVDTLYLTFNEELSNLCSQKSTEAVLVTTETSVWLAASTWPNGITQEAEKAHAAPLFLYFPPLLISHYLLISFLANFFHQSFIPFHNHQLHFLTFSLLAHLLPKVLLLPFPSP